MQVQIQLFASLASYLPADSRGKAINLEVEPGSNIQQVLDKLQIPMDSVKLVFKNGIHAKFEDILQENDRIGVFPPIGGG